MKRAALLLPLLAAPLLLAAEPKPKPLSDNWGWDRTEGAEGMAASKAICRRLGRPKPPAADLPSPAQSRALKRCSSETLYYGHGVRPDYTQARLCAFTEVEAGDELNFGGSVILMQIYANGLGVRRDLDLATAYACEVGGAPMERDGRVTHLQEIKTKRLNERFDFCDDITSGYATGACAGRENTARTAVRDARLKPFEARVSPAARPLYAAMTKAFDAFVEQHTTYELDLSGTARNAFQFEEENVTRDAHAKDLMALLTGAWPPASAAQAKSADAALNAAYRKALATYAANTGPNVGPGAITPAGIRDSQRLWLRYRDAFVAFARAAAPNLSPDAVLARLTAVRTRQLKALSDAG